LAEAQTSGASGRVTGGVQRHGRISFGIGSLTVNCNSGCPNPSYIDGPISPSSQTVSGTLHFSTTTDASGGIGGSVGGGTGQAQVSCDGGITWNSIAVGTATLPTTSMSWSYPTPTCSGPSNANTLQFRIFIGGGGSPSFNMNATAPSTVTISW
jgi:hypothetical protein